MSSSSTDALDAVKLNFDEGSLAVLNLILALVMFGIALDLKLEDFKAVLKEPRGVAVGMLAQLLILPALTWALTMVFQPSPSVALGMILVAACPGGNTSNFLTWYGRGDAGLSITITSLSTTLSMLATPFSFAFWAGLNPATAEVLREIHLDIPRLMGVVGLILALPLVLGMTVGARFPELAKRLQRPFKVLSLVCFIAFIVVALGNNFAIFLDNIGAVFLIVLVHNSLAFGSGWGCAWLAGLSRKRRRAVTMEVGIQNSGLALGLIFNIFGGLGGMAIIAAWWGIWHLIAGLSLATIWIQLDRRFLIDEPEAPAGAGQPSSS